MPSAFSPLEASRRQLLLLAALALVLFVAAGFGMAYVAGFGAIEDAITDASWPWLGACVGAVAVSYGAYYVVYRGIERAEHKSGLDPPSLLAAVAAGFGGFGAGGATIDNAAMKASGHGGREASVRVWALGGFELAILAVLASPAAMAVLVIGLGKPTSDVTLPWAVIPAVGFAAGIWFAERHRARFRDRGGWRGRLGVLLDAIHLVFELLRRPRRNHWAPPAMVLYWAAEIVAIWAALRAFGFEMNIAAVIVAFGTGMVLTRRTAPLAGAGVLTVGLAAAMWYCGAPWPAAVLGVIAWQLVTLVGTMPFSFAALPRLRALHRAERPREAG